MIKCTRGISHQKDESHQVKTFPSFLQERELSLLLNFSTWHVRSLSNHILINSQQNWFVNTDRDHRIPVIYTVMFQAKQWRRPNSAKFTEVLYIRPIVTILYEHDQHDYILPKCQCPPWWLRGSVLDCWSEDLGSIPGLPSPRVGLLMARRLHTSSDIPVPMSG